VSAPSLGYLVSPDLRTDVCPFGAMHWDFNRGVPDIDVDRCTACGLCAVRCPVGAIGLRGGSAQVSVNSELNELQVMEDRAFYAHREVVASVTHKAVVAGRMSDDTHVVRAVETFSDNALSQGAFRLLARNVLLASGMAAQLSKVGDNHSRIEMTFSDGTSLGLAELQPGEDLLDASRRLLADVAHAIATRGVQASAVRPTIVCGRLPNARTDVYNLLLDVDDALGLSVATIPLVALVAAVIARLSLEEFVQLLDAYRAPESAVLRLSKLTGFSVGSLVRGGAAPRK